MATDAKHPAWLPRAIRPTPSTLRRARAFTRSALGADLDKAHRIPGWLHPDQAAMLCYVAHICPDGPIVEIGSFKGKSTVFLGKGMKPTNTLHAIDPHIVTAIGSRQDRAAAKRAGGGNDSGDTSWSTFNNTLATWGIADKVTIIRAYSCDAQADFNDPIAMLWIDGDHAYEAVRQDIDDWVPLTMASGFVAFHDTHPKHLGYPGGSVLSAINDSGILESGGFQSFLQLRNTWILRRVPKNERSRN